MAHYDGQALTTYEAAREQTCACCDRRGITPRDGVLLCGTHAWNRAMDNVKSLFAGEVRPA